MKLQKFSPFTIFLLGPAVAMLFGIILAWLPGTETAGGIMLPVFIGATVVSSVFSLERAKEIRKEKIGTGITDKQLNRYGSPVFRLFIGVIVGIMVIGLFIFKVGPTILDFFNL